MGNLHAVPGYGPGSRAPYYNGPDGLIRLSDGPMWPELMFPGIRSINGSDGPGHRLNFSYGAATTGAWTVGAGEAGELPAGVQSQMSAYLDLRAAGAIPAPGPGAYAFIEAGTNDYILGMVDGEDLRHVAQASVERLAGSVRLLAAAGFSTVLVTETPDFGEAPLFRELGLPPAESEALRASLANLAGLSRAELRTALTRVQAELGDGHRVVVLPLNHLFRAAIANPAAFGFTNVTGRIYDDSSDTVLESDPGRRAGYLFVDSLHTTARAQEWQARYYREIVRAIDGTLQRRFARSSDSLIFQADVMRRLGDDALTEPGPADRWSPFVGVRAARGDGRVDKANDPVRPDWTGDTVAALVGAKRALSERWTLGLAIGTFEADGRLQSNVLGWEHQGTGLWLLNRWNTALATLTVSAGFTQTDTTYARDPAIPTFVARGETKSHVWQARAEARRPLGEWFNGIFGEVALGASFVHLTTDGFAERGAAGLDVRYAGLERRSIRPDISVRLRTETRLGGVKIQPAIDFLARYELGDRVSAVSAQLLDNTARPVRVEAEHGPRFFGGVRASLGFVLTERLRAEIADEVRLGASKRTEHQLEVALRARF